MSTHKRSIFHWCQSWTLLDLYEYYIEETTKKRRWTLALSTAFHHKLSGPRLRSDGVFFFKEMEVKCVANSNFDVCRLLGSGDVAVLSENKEKKSFCYIWRWNELVGVSILWRHELFLEISTDWDISRRLPGNFFKIFLQFFFVLFARLVSWNDTGPYFFLIWNIKWKNKIINYRSMTDKILRLRRVEKRHRSDPRSQLLKCYKFFAIEFSALNDLKCYLSLLRTTKDNEFKFSSLKLLVRKPAGCCRTLRKSFRIFI